MMRIMILMLPVFWMSCVEGGELIIFDAKLSLTNSCELAVSSRETRVTYKPQFKHPGECRIVSHDGTNVPHIEYINGAYILFVENVHASEGECTSEFTAVGITRELVFHATERVKSSRSCHQDQEIQSFEYFSTKLHPYTKRMLEKKPG